MLQSKGATKAESYSQSHRGEEGEQEDADAMEEGRKVDVFAMKLRESSAGHELV